MNSAEPRIVSISGATISSRASVYLLLFYPAPGETGPSKRTTARWKTRKRWKVDSWRGFLFNRYPTRLRAWKRRRESSRFVSRPFSPCLAVLLFFPPSRHLFCYFIRVHGKDIRCRRRRPYRRTGEASDDSIIDRHVQRGWSRPLTITRAVNGGIYALDSTYIRRFDAPRAAAFHGRPRFPFSATAPQHHVRQTRRVICIKMESNTVRCEARNHRAHSLHILTGSKCMRNT